MCWLAAILLFALPVGKWWQLTHDGSTFIAWAALMIAFSWWVGRAVVEVPTRTTVAAAVIGLGTLIAWVWLLTWLRVEDFWVLRWGFCVMGVALSLVLWGWVGPVRALRPLLALVLWAVQPPGTLQYVDSPPWLCNITAQVAGFCIWQHDSSAVIRGATIFLPQGAVLVAGGCTMLSLLLALGHLFLPAWLIFRLSLRRALLIAATVTGVAFLLSIVRVIIMAYAVGDHERFDYWHGTPGGSWFTAGGMLVMAWMIDRAISVRQSPRPDEHASLARGQAMLLGGLAVFAAVATIGAVLLPEKPASKIVGVTPGFAGYKLVAQADEAMPRSYNPGKFPFAAERRAMYETPLKDSQVQVRFCIAPTLLAGDPVDAAWNYGWFDRTQGLSVFHEVDLGNGMMVRELKKAGQRTWMATLPGDAAPLANYAQWQAVGTQRLSGIANYLLWIVGRAPLRDKRAGWIELVWTGVGEPPLSELRAALADWSALAAENLKPLR